MGDQVEEFAHTARKESVVPFFHPGADGFTPLQRCGLNPPRSLGWKYKHFILIRGHILDRDKAGIVG